MASSLLRRVSCLSRSLSLVCKIPVLLLGLSETNTIGYYGFCTGSALKSHMAGSRTGRRGLCCAQAQKVREGPAVQDYRAVCSVTLVPLGSIDHIGIMLEGV
jgi:hypothetical protein